MCTKNHRHSKRKKMKLFDGLCLFYGNRFMVRAPYINDMKTNKSIKKLLLFLILFFNYVCSIKRYKQLLASGHGKFTPQCQSRCECECQLKIDLDSLSCYSTFLTAILIQLQYFHLVPWAWVQFHFFYFQIHRCFCCCHRRHHLILCMPKL